MAAILFDIDGTLLDTAPGVMNSARFALRTLGLAELPEEALRRFVGPPPRESYQRLCGLDSEKALAAALLHRQYGREKGLFESRPYPGIAQLLPSLLRRGAKLGVATLKAQDVAERILEFHDLQKYFSAIVGVDAGESRSKSETIRIALDRLGEPCDRAVLVGDSEYDREGASLAGVRFLGVTWGYGFPPGEPGMISSIPELEEKLKGATA